jgi:DNA modification methylase
MSEAEILVGDVRQRIAGITSESIQTCITSPPYFGLRDYGHDDQIGAETSPSEYVEELVTIFREVRRVLKDDGTLWLNLGDSYNSPHSGGHGATGGRDKSTLSGPLPPVGSLSPKRGHDGELGPKQLLGIPWRVAFALQADGWYLRSDIIWAKPNPMPESVLDRCTKSHEYLFLLSKSPRYLFDSGAISEAASTGWNGSNFDTGKTAEHQLQRMQPRFGGAKYGDSEDPRHATKSGNEYEPDGRRNKRDVWTIGSQLFAGAHFAVMPEALVEPCVLAGSREGDTVLDPFAGSGTVGVVALRHQRNFTGIELNPEYAQMARNRIVDDGPLLNSCEMLA